MAYTFAETLSTDRDVLRAALGLVGSGLELRSDEALDATLARFADAASPLDASARFLAQSLLLEFSTKPTAFSESGEFSITWGNRIAGWRLILESKAGAISGVAASWAAVVDLTTDIFEPAEALT